MASSINTMREGEVSSGEKSTKEANIQTHLNIIRRHADLISQCIKTMPEQRFTACYICKDPSHWANDCPKKQDKSYNLSSQWSCYACGKRGHYARDCPGKKKTETTTDLEPEMVDEFTQDMPEQKAENVTCDAQLISPTKGHFVKLSNFTCHICGKKGHYLCPCRFKKTTTDLKPEMADELTKEIAMAIGCPGPKNVENNKEGSKVKRSVKRKRTL